MNITAKPGTKVQLSAKGSYDPDGNELVYKWWQYKEAETYKGDVEIQNANEPEASFIVPENASKGQTIHIVCSVKDNGSPKLTRYQRVIVTIN
ncbi:PKD domain-containing protein [Prolixibacter bellariivorans]|uniref:PKD domain-containing protein n=1 Tax=Prolixibacter bellariivorans TaxID=314319 RepID=UPI001900CA79|nr:hypothetical protein [Prolixibacter bellariivorans]